MCKQYNFYIRKETVYREYLTLYKMILYQIFHPLHIFN